MEEGIFIVSVLAFCQLFGGKHCFQFAMAKEKVQWMWYFLVADTTEGGGVIKGRNEVM